MRNVQRGRSGWTPEEEDLLFQEIKSSESSGRPLREVFEAVAEKTGRRPNSIRNYYYARIKEKDLSTTALHAGAFVPFSEEEIRSLLRTVLSAQANGISVRSCTMSMGGGDNRAMLRYQNKYRALIRNRSGLVKQVAEELKGEGVCFDPYEIRQKREQSDKPRQDAIERLRKRGDGGPLLRGLNLMAELGEESLKRGAGAEELKRQLREKDEELSLQQRRFHSLLMAYRELVSANRDFLGKAMTQQGHMPEYARGLAMSVADGERALREYNA